ncbi:hypothetical protein, partial [Listeria monocytogenes]
MLKQLTNYIHERSEILLKKDDIK